MRTAERKVYVIGGYYPAGGTYMAYHLGRIAASLCDWRCRIVSTDGETAEAGRWAYPVLYDTVPVERLAEEITDRDLLICNPSYSAYLFGCRLRGRKLMYVQGFNTFSVIDGFFDGYVCATEFLRDFLRSVYGIAAPVIPPFVHLERIPQGAPWPDRPAGRIRVATKVYGDTILDRFEQAMRRRAPALRYSLEVLAPEPHAARLARLAESRYFLTLSPCEGFGLTPLEAMAAGCTVVGFHGGGGMEYMRPGVNCAAVGYPDVDGLCEALVSVLTDEEAAQALARRGRETAGGYGIERFEASWRSFLEQFLAD